MKFAWIVEPPFNFRKGEALTGCDVELARRAFSALDEAFEPVEAEFGDLLPGLADGRWEVTTGMFITPDRSLRASFTQPIWALRDALLVRKDDSERISGYRDIARNGDRMAVLEGQIQHRTALDLGIQPDNIIVLRNYDEAADAVATGRVRAYASVELAHRDHVSRHPDLACISVADAEKQPEAGGFACANSEVRDRLSAVLADLMGREWHAGMLRFFGLDPASIRPAAG